MQNNDQKALEGDKACRPPTEGSFQQVTPHIKHAAAALASLIRSQENSGDKIRASALSAFLTLPKSSIGELTPCDDEVDEVDSAEEEDIICPRSSKPLRPAESGIVDAETRARLRALLESSGLSKLSAADGISLSDPEVLQRLTDQVSTAMDEAASSLLRFKAEQHHRTSGVDSPCAHSSCDIEGVDVQPLDDAMSCPDSIDQALQGDSLLLMTCSAGFYELSQVLLALKCDVEDRGSKGDRTPLMEAASGGYLDVVRLLIAHKAQVNAQSASGNTALHYAASGGFVDVARELILAGAKVEEPNENGHTPLMEAATGGQVEVASLLLSKGAKINTHSTEFKESALTLACYKGHLDMVKFLLEKGADLEHKTDEMHTALMEASMDGHVDVVRLLLDHGAQVNMPTDSFESPLTLAACGGHTDLAALLIDRGANLEEVNDEGYTPLMEAVREGHEEMVTLLLSRGADVNAQTEETQETALTLACCGGFLEIAELLVASKGNIELGCSTPLMEAAQEGHVRLVEYLIKSGANVNAQTFTKGTALTYASENGHTDVAEILIQHGAELDHESEGGRTALMRASKNGHLPTVKFLVSKGACLNKATTNNDHTVLSVACANGHLQVVDFLLRSGADFNHKLKDGSTMLIEAAKGGHFDIMNLLLDWPTYAERVSATGETTLSSSQPVNTDKTEKTYKEKTAVQSEVGDPKAPLNIRNGAREVADVGGNAATPGKCLTSKSPPVPQPATINGSGESTRGTSMSSLSDVGELPDDQLSWEAFFGKMASKGDLLGLGREEQIVVKQQMLDRLVQLERELQERTLTTKGKPTSDDDGVANTALLDETTSSSVAARNRFLVVNDRLRGDEELAIAILEKAVLGETVLDQVMLDQLKAYIRGGGGGGDAGSHNQSPIGDVMQDFESHSSFHGPGGDFACDEFENSSVDSAASSEEGEKFEDACSDDAGQYVVEGGNSVVMLPQLDRLEKQITSPQRPVLDQADISDAVTNETVNDPTALIASVQQTRALADGVEASILSKNKDRSIKVSRRLMKVPLPPSDAVESSSPSRIPSRAAHLAELERNLTLQQQRHHLQTQLVLQQQLHDELQQHLRLQQEHQQLQAQLKVKEGARPAVSDGAVAPSPPSANLNSSQAQAMLSPLDHQCCRHQQPCPQQRHHVQQQLLQLQHQLQQAAGHTNNESLHQAQQQAMKLAMMHQKRNSIQTASGANNITAAATVTQSTQTNTLPAAETANIAKNVNISVAPVTGNAATLSAQKKASECAALNQLNVDSSRPAAAVRLPGTPSQVRAKLLPPAPCPNCCVDGAKPAARIAPSANSNAQQSSIDVDAQTESNHDTALTLAAAGGHARLVSLLISRGANVEHRDKKGLTPLALAAAAGHVEVCEVLLAHKADIEAQTEKNKDTALSLACASGRLEVVTLLLSKGANKEHRNISDYTPLSQAASGGYVNVIKVLLAHGSEINSRTGSKMGISPLMLAAMNGHTAAVKLLLDMGSDINAQIETNRNTALTLACFQGRYEVVSLLIDRKANIEHRAKTGLTPLMEAASGGYVEVGRVLLDKGADIAAAPVPVSRDTALTIAADKGHHRFVELLISRGAAIDVRNKKGNTPLWLACNGGHVECVQLLVAAGADVHAEDNRRVSCIIAAFRKAHIKVVKVLVRYVTQFPPDQDCIRYITTLSDKELVKRCHSCMTLIVSAKEQQAAEANKNAAILLEELSLEREREETKRAAAARKRDRKKLKKKERADHNAGMPPTNGDAVDADDNENEDDATSSNKITFVTNGLSALSVTSVTTPMQNSDATTLPVKKPGFSEVIEKETPAPVNPAATVSSGFHAEPPCVPVETVPQAEESRRSNARNKRDRQKAVTDSNKTVAELSVVVPTAPVVSRSNGATTATVLESSPVIVANDLKSAEQALVPSAQSSVKMPKLKAAPGIGDLDDFGALVVTNSSSTAQKTTVKKAAPEKTAPEKPRIVVVEAKNVPLSKKTSNAAGKSGGAKKNGRKDDDWEEVTRKSKRLLVPASAISRVIGRGGCNINAIRDISTAQVEIDRSRDATTERIITIKGSVEATKYAQSLIEALINDTDKKFEHQLPKLKPLTSSSSAQHGLKQKQSATTGKVFSASPVAASVSKEDITRSSSVKVTSSVSLPSAWAQAVLQSKPKAVVSGSDITVSSAWNASTSRLTPPDISRMYSDRAKVTVTTVTDTTVSWSPSIEKMAGNNFEAPTTAPTTAARHEPVPLGAVMSTSSAVSRPAAVATTIVRDYSPFDNMLSQITESVLAKRTTDDFASVAAAGIVVTSSQLLAPVTFADDTSPYPLGPGIATDPDLMAKAPGYRPLTVADPSKAPGHRAGKDMLSFGPRGCTTTSSAVNDNSYLTHDYGRPNSTPNAAMSLINDTNLVGRALGSSLDRPPSLYSAGNIYGPGPSGLVFPQNNHLPPFSANVHSMEAFVSTFQPGVQQTFGAPCSLGNSVNETSVLAAPLMTTSVAPGMVASHDHVSYENRLGMPATSSTELMAEQSAELVEATSHNSPISVELHQMQQQQNGVPVLEDHRKPLGPIGTERASRRPPPPVSHQSDFGFPLSNEIPASMWNLANGASTNWPLFSALADQSVLTATGLHIDNGTGSLQHHSMEFPVGYQGFGGIDNSGMMISDMYQMDPSLIDPATMQHMFQAGHPAMLMQFPGDIQAPYNGMLRHAPPPSYQQYNHAGFMMAPDAANNMWGMSSQMPGNSATDIPPYLGPKGQQMMWNQSWTPSANM